MNKYNKPEKDKELLRNLNFAIDEMDSEDILFIMNKISLRSANQFLAEKLSLDATTRINNLCSNFEILVKTIISMSIKNDKKNLSEVWDAFDSTLSESIKNLKNISHKVLSHHDLSEEDKEKSND